MNDLLGAWQYVLQNWGTWSGALVRQLEYLLALPIAMVICIPLGILAARSRAVSFVALNIFGAARAIPSIAILFLAIPVLPLLGLSGFGPLPVLIALVILACPPILVNTAAGYQGVDAAVIEAARGMGMGGWQVLRKIETPLALPIVMAGVRTATLEVIASATLATFIGGGGFGDIITQGLANSTINVLLAGALPVALLALGAEALFSGLQRVISPPI
jgi:osmoprotectant transport system permease protein